MSWRVREHYGFGAGNVQLSAEPHYVAHRSLQFLPSLRDAGRDFYTTSLPPLILAVFMFTTLFVTVSTDRGYTDLEVVMIGSESLPLAEETPEPEPVIPEPEPEPVPEKKPEPPPVQKIAKKKPEPPKVAKPKPPKPPPPPVKRIARQKPKPVPKARPKAPPKPVVKPDFQKLAMAPKPAPPPPVRRGNRVREQVAKPKMALAPLAAAPKLETESDSRPRRFAAVRAPTKSSRPKADLGPPIAARRLDAPSPAAPPARTRRSAPQNAADRRVAKVKFAGGALAPAAPAPEEPSSARRSRTQPQPNATRRRAAPPPMEMAAAAPSAPTMKLSSSASRSADRDRTERIASQRKRSDHTAGKRLAGVPLASLAACVSDAEEDALKRRLLAAVTTQRECVSRAGTYRFVETKNLNAFLMTIERAAGRPVADRCEELQYALTCVQR